MTTSSTVCVFISFQRPRLAKCMWFVCFTFFTINRTGKIDLVQSLSSTQFGWRKFGKVLDLKFAAEVKYRDRMIWGSNKEILGFVFLHLCFGKIKKSSIRFVCLRLVSAASQSDKKLCFLAFSLLQYARNVIKAAFSFM